MSIRTVLTAAVLQSFTRKTRGSKPAVAHIRAIGLSEGPSGPKSGKSQFSSARSAGRARFARASG